MPEPAPAFPSQSQDTPPQSQETAPQTQVNQEMGELLEGHEPGYKSLRRGDVVDGVVVRIDRDEVLVDIGAKSEAIIPSQEISSPEPESLEVGSEIVAYVLQAEDREGHAVLSLSRAQAERKWRRLHKHFESADVLDATVVEHNRGGLIVNVMGVRGFIPLSQVADLRRGDPQDPQAVEEKLRSQAGRHIKVKIIEMNRRRNRLIMSERAALQQARAEQKQRLLEELEPGQVRRGVVSSVCDFGAFVDLGGADGLAHLSELSWRQVPHPSSVVSVGEEVDVAVLAVDREKKKIALSMKRLKPEPWSQVAEKYEVGQMVTGHVTKLATFGAFAEVEDGVEGLIHISELSDERITHPKQVVREADRVEVRVLRIDPARRRLGLSLRQGGHVYETADAEQPEAGTEVAHVATEVPGEAGATQMPQADSEVEEPPEAGRPGEAETAAVDEPAPEVAEAVEAEASGLAQAEAPDQTQAEAPDQVEAEVSEEAEAPDRVAAPDEADADEASAEATDQTENGREATSKAVETKPEDRADEQATTGAQSEDAAEWAEPMAHKG